ncbi:nuclear speckle splicing regulatory protein 1-like isoform X2 [Dreissena polymorpha]|uniref:nuclear speckle splicing regulatory protein 1-like isoform X2 n=1 Tax=Dreissena polymorpha TaxID=45954 RepID=UPI002263DA74|nr:nuclear speckle splicing regulatory protein 1-like isoform X2 [Dreissena polymorpha]
MAAPWDKKYGLFVPNSSKKPGVVAVANVFGEDEDEKPETNTKKGITSKYGVTSNNKKVIKKQTQLDIDKALQEDPSVFEYDSVYDDMVGKKAEKAHVKKVLDNKPRYIEQLLKASEKRKADDERRQERKIQKEREAEGEEFADKEVFVTTAYKKKMEERQEEEERERKEMELEAKQDVTKQNDLTGFYRYILDETTKDPVKQDQKHSSSSETSSDSDREIPKQSNDANCKLTSDALSFKPSSSTNRKYRQRDSNNGSDTEEAKRKRSRSRSPRRPRSRSPHRPSLRKSQSPKSRHRKRDKHDKEKDISGYLADKKRSRSKDRHQGRSGSRERSYRKSSRSKDRVIDGVPKSNKKLVKEDNLNEKDRESISKSNSELGQCTVKGNDRPLKRSQDEANLDTVAKEKRGIKSGNIYSNDKENEKEQKNKYARISTAEEIEAARTRYLVRKLAREKAMMAAES